MIQFFYCMLVCFFFFFACEANFLVVLILLNKTIAPAVCYCRYLLGLAPLLQIWMSRNVTRFVAANKDKWLLSYCYYDAFVLWYFAFCTSQLSLSSTFMSSSSMLLWTMKIQDLLIVQSMFALMFSNLHLLCWYLSFSFLFFLHPYLKCAVPFPASPFPLFSLSK